MVFPFSSLKPISLHIGTYAEIKVELDTLARGALMAGGLLVIASTLPSKYVGVSSNLGQYGTITEQGVSDYVSFVLSSKGKEYLVVDINQKCSKSELEGLIQKNEVISISASQSFTSAPFWDKILYLEECPVKLRQPSYSRLS